MPAGVMSQRILETPIAVLDFETTGLAAGPDRVVEVSVVRIDPGKDPVIVLDTLVNPDRPMAATEIHGITDKDVADAPRFLEIGGDFIRSISGCVVASYNIYFDINFLTYELFKIRINSIPPHLCLMYMRPLLNLGKRCSLSQACTSFDISLPATHLAAADAYASAVLWKKYFQIIEEQKLQTFQDLLGRKPYKFLQSFKYEPLRSSAVNEMPSSPLMKSRGFKPKIPGWPPVGAGTSPLSRHDALHQYWDEITTVLADLEVTRGEVTTLERKKKQLELTVEEVRGIHARAFANLLTQCVEDRVINTDEKKQLHRLYQCLSKLGWAPGQ